MEQPPKVKHMACTYALERGFLSSPHLAAFDLSFNLKAPYEENPSAKSCVVSISQGPKRTITIDAEQYLYWSEFLIPLGQVEKLLMLFDGAFVPLTSLEFSDPESSLCSTGNSKSMREQALGKRLSYFHSSDYMSIQAKLLEFDTVITSDLFKKWQRLLDELEIIHQVYLYAVSDNGLPCDMSLAFVVEMAESLTELLNSERGMFRELYSHGVRGAHLALCVKALICSYGQIVFASEMDAVDSLSDRLKNARVQVMHIKRRWGSEKCFDGGHCLLYIRKLSLMYRLVLLDLLGIERDLYENRARAITKRLDDWAAHLAAE